MQHRCLRACWVLSVLPLELSCLCNQIAIKTPLVWESSCQQLQRKKGVSAASGACTAFAMEPGGFCSLKRRVCASGAWNSLRWLLQPRADTAQDSVLFSCLLCEGTVAPGGMLWKQNALSGLPCSVGVPTTGRFFLTASGSCSLSRCRAPHAWIPSSSSFGEWERNLWWSELCREL